MSVPGDRDSSGENAEPDVAGSSTTSRPIGWTEMRQLLEQVADRLDPDEPVDMWIAGGSALASADLRLTTTDVDVVSEVPEVVYEVARALAGEVALPPGWLTQVPEHSCREAQRRRSCSRLGRSRFGACRTTISSS